MNAIDTNVLIYRLDRSEPIKQAKARALLRTLKSAATPTMLLWQVFGEFVRQLRYWQDQGKISRATLLKYVTTIQRTFPLEMPMPAVMAEALDLAGRYSLSHWDSHPIRVNRLTFANPETLGAGGRVSTDCHPRTRVPNMASNECSL